MMHAQFIDYETGKELGFLLDEEFPRKGEVVFITNRKMISKYVVENVEWNLEVNTLYPKDPLMRHYPKIFLSIIVTVPCSSLSEKSTTEK